MSDDTKGTGQPQAAPAPSTQTPQPQPAGQPAPAPQKPVPQSNEAPAQASPRQPKLQTPPPLPGERPPAPAPEAAPQAGATEPAANDEQPIEEMPDIEALEKQIANLTDRLLRANAELQNLHKRLEREREETAKYAISKFAGDTVAVADNFERAIAAVPAEALDGNPILKALVDGVTMTEREFLNVLERHGVNRIDPAGELFDPHMHQAVMEKPDTTVPSGTVLEVFQPGYVIGERSLRPAMVVVAKGGPKSAQPAAAAESIPPAAQPIEPPEPTDNGNGTA